MISRFENRLSSQLSLHTPDRVYFGFRTDKEDPLELRIFISTSEHHKFTTKAGMERCYTARSSHTAAGKHHFLCWERCGDGAHGR